MPDTKHSLKILNLQGRTFYTTNHQDLHEDGSNSNGDNLLHQWYFWECHVSKLEKALTANALAPLLSIPMDWLKNKISWFTFSLVQIWWLCPHMALKGVALQKDLHRRQYTNDKMCAIKPKEHVHQRHYTQHNRKSNCWLKSWVAGWWIGNTILNACHRIEDSKDCFQRWRLHSPPP